MFSGFYTAAAGLLTQQRNLDTLTNNIVNQKTPGYQTERLVTTTFDYEYTIRKDAYGKTAIGGSSPILLSEEVPVLLESGLMEETGRSLDMALDGAGFFNIRRTTGTAAAGTDAAGDAAGAAAADETKYLTRNGKFDLDEEGYLILKDVGRVQGMNGDIQLGSADFTVTGDGYIFDENGDEIDQLMLTWPGTENVTRYQNGLYLPKDAAQSTVATAVTVVQANLESSSVDVNREMTEVMEANRALQACSSAMKIIDEMNQKAATQIAKL